jgi:hypothetical protein
MRKKGTWAKDVAEQCKCSKRTVVAWAKENDVMLIPIGKYGLYVFDEEDIARFKHRKWPDAVKIEQGYVPNKCGRALERAMEKMGRTFWETDDYLFLFKRRSFQWKGKTLDLTQREILHLYERLVLGKKDGCSSGPGTMSGMRKRLGNAFLEDVLPKMQCRVRKGRRSNMELELTGEWTKKERERFEEARREGMRRLAERKL